MQHKITEEEEEEEYMFFGYLSNNFCICMQLENMR